MPLAAGSRFGPYEVLAPLGAGGMGEVHHARETRIGRQMAVKVLPEAARADTGASVRLRREAVALSTGTRK